VRQNQSSDHNQNSSEPIHFAIIAPSRVVCFFFIPKQSRCTSGLHHSSAELPQSRSLQITVTETGPFHARTLRDAIHSKAPCRGCCSTIPSAITGGRAICCAWQELSRSPFLELPTVALLKRQESLPSLAGNPLLRYLSITRPRSGARSSTGAYGRTSAK
jgi:hypothetical protein